MPESLPSILVTTLDKTSTGTRHHVLPLHVAISPLFRAKEGLDAFSNRRITDITLSRNRFWIAGMEEKIIGGNRVRLVGAASLYLMQERLMPIVHKLDASVDIDAEVESYEPHVAYNGKLGLEKDVRKTITEVTLYQQQEGEWYVAKQYPLNIPNNDFSRSDTA